MNPSVLSQYVDELHKYGIEMCGLKTALNILASAANSYFFKCS